MIQRKIDEHKSERRSSQKMIERKYENKHWIWIYFKYNIHAKNQVKKKILLRRWRKSKETTLEEGH